MALPPKLEQTRPTGHGRARGLVSSRVSGRRVESTTFAPPNDLRDVVDVLWSASWDLPADAPHTTELLSDPCAHIAFEGGDRGPESRFVGVWTRLWRRTLVGRGYVRAAKLRPGALRAFVSRPAVSLVNRIVPLGELVGAEAAGLEAPILELPEEEALLALAEWLRSRRASTRTSALAVDLVERIMKDATIVRVEDLARVAGYGPRALQRLFRDEVGASPKWVIRRYRLQEAALRIERGDGPTLAALAAELGYADQAHLARDFKRAVGRSPSAFAESVYR
jgi:AraC-like DNA-binding protein